MKTRPWGISKRAQAVLLLVTLASGLFVIIYQTALQADENCLQQTETAKPASQNAVISSKDSATNITSSTGPSETNTNASEVVVAKIPPDLSALNLKPELEEIVRMAQSGVGEEVLIQYVAQSKYSYKDLTARDIITLNDLGVPS